MTKVSDRQESKQKQYKIDVRSIVENHNPRNPIPERVKLASCAGKPYSLFTGDTAHVATKSGEFDVKLDLWQLGASEKADERAKYCELMEMDEDFVAWAGTMLTVGQLEPVELRDNGKKADAGNTYTIVFGCRRCLAILYNWCKLGGKGVPWVNAVLAPKLNENGLLHRSIVENIRKDPNPMEGARAIKMALNQGQERQEVAQVYGKSESWVRNMEKLLELPIDVQRQIEAGTLKPTKALEAAAAKPGEDKPKSRPAVVSSKVWQQRTRSLADVGERAVTFLEELKGQNNLSADELEALLKDLRAAIKEARDGQPGS